MSLPREITPLPPSIENSLAAKRSTEVPELIDQLLAELPQQERTCIEVYYGLSADPDSLNEAAIGNMAQTAREVGLSTTGATNRVNTALSGLRGIIEREPERWQLLGRVMDDLKTGDQTNHGASDEPRPVLKNWAYNELVLVTKKDEIQAKVDGLVRSIQLSLDQLVETGLDTLLPEPLAEEQPIDGKIRHLYQLIDSLATWAHMAENPASDKPTEKKDKTPAKPRVTIDTHPPTEEEVIELGFEHADRMISAEVAYDTAIQQLTGEPLPQQPTTGQLLNIIRARRQLTEARKKFRQSEGVASCAVPHMLEKLDERKRGES